MYINAGFQQCSILEFYGIERRTIKMSLRSGFQIRLCGCTAIFGKMKIV